MVKGRFAVENSRNPPDLLVASFRAAGAYFPLAGYANRKGKWGEIQLNGPFQEDKSSESDVLRSKLSAKKFILRGALAV